MGSLLQLSLRCLTHAPSLVHNCGVLAPGASSDSYVNKHSERKVDSLAKVNKQDLFGWGYSVPGKSAPRGIVLPSFPALPTLPAPCRWPAALGGYGAPGTQMSRLPKGAARSAAHPLPGTLQQKVRVWGAGGTQCLTALVLTKRRVTLARLPPETFIKVECSFFLLPFSIYF